MPSCEQGVAIYLCLYSKFCLQCCKCYGEVFQMWTCHVACMFLHLLLWLVDICCDLWGYCRILYLFPAYSFLLKKKCCNDGTTTQNICCAGMGYVATQNISSTSHTPVRLHGLAIKKIYYKIVKFVKKIDTIL